jgi:hypothetical protein
MPEFNSPKATPTGDVYYTEDEPHGWVQLKNTEICIDLHCECGAHGHYDGYFCHEVKCKHCGKCYKVGMNVALIPMTDAEIQKTESQRGFIDLYDEDLPVIQVEPKKDLD